MSNPIIEHFNLLIIVETGEELKDLSQYPDLIPPEKEVQYE